MPPMTVSHPHPHPHSHPRFPPGSPRYSRIARGPPSESSPFFYLLAALKEFTDQSEMHIPPLTSTQDHPPRHEIRHLRSRSPPATLQNARRGGGVQEPSACPRGRRRRRPVRQKRTRAAGALGQWGAFNQDMAALGACHVFDRFCRLTCGGSAVDGLVSSPKETSTHLALSALSALEGDAAGSPPILELLRR